MLQRCVCGNIILLQGVNIGPLYLCSTCSTNAELLRLMTESAAALEESYWGAFTTYGIFCARWQGILLFPAAPYMINLDVKLLTPGLQLWLDATDPLANGSLLTNGTPITTWYDKSGNLNNATGLVSPFYANYSIVFNGDSSLDTTLTARPAYETIFVVFLVAAPLSDSFMMVGSNSQAGRGLRIYNNSLGYNVSGVGGYSNTDGGIVRAITTLVSGTISGGPDNGVGTTFINGGKYISQSQVFTTYGEGLTRIGGGNGSDFFNGTISEVLIYNRALSTSERQRVEGYLAWKWRINSSLPSTHNYYNSFDVVVEEIAALTNLPTFITSVNMTNVLSTEFTVNWSGGNNTTYYRYIINGIERIPLDDKGVLSGYARFGGFTPGSINSVIINAYNSVGSRSSSTFQAGTSASQPASLSQTTPLLNGFTINWSPVIGATGYIYSLNGIITTPTSSTPTSATFTGLDAGTRYTVIVTAINTYGSSSSAPFITTTRPSQPTSLNVSNASASGFTINWIGGIGATSYTYTFNGNLTIPVSTTSNSATFSGLSPGISYTITVIANNSLIPFDSTVSAPFITITAPSQPTSLVASNIRATGFIISWTGGTGAISYRYTLNGNTIIPTTNRGVVSKYAVFTGLSEDIPLVIVVIAVNTSGSTSSNPISITRPPTTPSSLVITNATPSGFQINWSGGLGATSYTYQLNGIKVVPSNDQGLTGKYAVFTGLSPGITYNVTVIASNAGGFIMSDTIVSSLTGLQIWLDGANPLGSGILPSNGSVLPLWYDLSTNFYNATGVDSPTYTTSGISFNGTSQYYTTNYTSSAPAESIFVVYKMNTVGNMYLIDTTDNGGRSFISTVSNGPSLENSPSVSKLMGLYPVGINTKNIAECLYNSSGISIYVNGNISSSNSTNPGFYAGTTNIGAGNYNGTILELIIYNSVLSTTDRQKIEGYLAWKWGIENTLPLAHPYYSISPKGSVSASTIPSQPVSITQTNSYATGFTINWTGGNGATSYRYTINDAPLTPSIDLGLSNKSIILDGLTIGTSYQIVIIATNSSGSSLSVGFTAKTIPSKPRSLTLSNITVDGFTVSWLGGNTATSYSYTLNGSPITPSNDQGVLNKTATFSGISSNISYNLIIIAINSSGSSTSGIELNPTTIPGIQVWLDAADPLNTGSPGTNGAPVITWYDKSGKGNNMTFSGSSITYANNSVNSLSTIFANGIVGASLSIPINTFTGNYCGFIVLRNTTADKTPISIFDRRAGGQGVPFLQDSGGSYLVGSTSLGNPTEFISKGVGTTLVEVLITTYASTGGTGNFNCYINGAPITFSGGSVTGLNAVDTGQSNISFAGPALQTADMITNYSEIIMYNSNLSIANRQLIEGYLAWKWGLQNKPLYAPRTYLFLTTNATDTGINPQTVTNNNVVFSKNNYKASARFNNSTSTYLSMPFPYGTGSFTISYWFTANDGTPLSLSNNATGASYGINSDFSNGIQSCNLAFSGATLSMPTFSYPGAVGTWNHFALTVNAATGFCQIYGNGVLKTSGLGSGTLNNTAYLIIGKAGDNARGFNGSINNFAVYNSSLSSSQILDIYNSQSVTNSLPPTHPYFALAPLTALSVSTLPVTPSSFSLTNVSPTGFTVNWAVGTGASNYTFTLNTVSTAPSLLSVNSATFTGLSPGTAYSVLVTAINAEGVSVTSAPYNVGTTPSKPSPLFASNLTDIGFQVNWSGGIGATSYIYTLNGSPVTPLIDDGVDNKYAIFSGLTPNTTYTIIVTAVNSIGSSVSESPISPLSISGLQLWLDGNDPLNTGVAGTNNVSLTTWYDKSRNFRNMIWTGSSITYANSSINSLNTIYVNGTTLGTVNIPIGTFSSNYCGFMVIKNGTPAPFVVFSRTNTSAYGIFDYYEGRDLYVSTSSGNRTYVGSTVGTGGPEPTLRSFKEFPIMMNFGLTNYAATGNTGVFNMYYNGLPIPYTGGQTTGINGVDTLSSSIYFGGREGVSFNHTANYCEILLFNTNITNTDRQKLEGYLAWKWGLQSVRPYIAQTILLLNENTLDTGINSQTVTNNSVSIISITTNPSKKNSANFTGTNYLSLPFNYGAGSFSITYWSYSTTVGPMTAWSLSSSATGASGAPGINADFTNGVQHFYLTFAGGIVNAGNWSSPANSLTWYQSILTVNAVTGECKSYLNGVLKNTVSGIGALQNTGNLLLGRNATNTQGFNGYLTNFAAYNYVLSQAQITTIYNSESVVSFLPSSHPYYSSPPFSVLSVFTLAIKPESLNLTNVTTTGFTVNWVGATGITRFSYTLNDITTIPSSSTLSSATFTGLIPGTVYLIVVSSINVRGGSTASDVFTGSTTPSQPTTLSSSSISGTGFTISWTGGASAISYTYTLNGSPTIPSNDQGVASKTATFTGLSGGTLYAIIVTATNAFGSTASASFNVATSPGQPTSLNATNIVSAGFTVNWSGAFGATSYTYTIDGITKVPTSSTSTSATFTGLLAGTSYAVIVSAVNISGFTASSSLSILTLPSVPFNVSQTAGSLSSITVSWLGGFGATSYTYTLNGSSVTASDNQGLTSKYAVFTGLNSGTIYSIVVTAVNSSGSISSPPSVENVPGIYLWIDGNDPLGSGTLPANNSTVSTLYDKSGNSRNLSVTSPAYPATFSTNSVNGMANLIFANSVYRTATLTGSVLFPFDVYLVLKLNSVTAAASICSISQSNSASSYNALTFSSSKWSNASESSSRTSATVASSTETSTSYILIQWSFGNSNFNIYRNGSQIAYTSAYTWVAPASLSFLLGLTVDNTTTGNFNGAIAEIVAYNTLQGTTNRQYIEGALAWKWGIQSSLSTIHPYYSTRPAGPYIYTAPTAPTSLSQTAGSATGFTINWSGASGATKFTYTLNAISVTAASSTSTSATFTGLTIASSYAVIVTAFNGTIANTPSASFTAITSPTAPYDIVVSNTSINAFTVSWSGGLTATSYTYTLNGSLVTPSIDNGVASKTARFTGLTAGTTYSLSIGAVNLAGSTPGNISITTAPTAPTSLASSEITSTSFKISWSGGLAATSYSYTLNGSSVTPSINNGVASRNATFTGLTFGTAYNVSVTAINSSGSSSGTLSVTTAPDSPTGLTSSEATTTSFKVSWTGGQGATSYTYTLGGVTTVPSTEAGVASKYAIFTGLTAGQSYVVIVTSVLSGISVSSSPLNTVTLASVPNTLSSSARTTTGFTVSWSGGVGATSYTYTLNGSLVTPSVDNGVASRTATFTGLTAGTSYTVSVNATNSSGSSSGTLSVFTAPGVPTALASSEATTVAFKVSWTGAQGATSYTYTLGGVTTVPSTDSGVASKFAIFTGLTAGQSYVVIVNAVLSGLTTSSSPLNTVTLPSVPTSLSSSAVNSTGFTVSWLGGVGATSYTYTLNGSLVTPSVDNGIASKTATFTGLTEGTTYDVNVNAVNTSGTTVGGTVYNALLSSGLQLWFDASDPLATGSVPANGTAITTWFDKSGYGYNGAVTGTVALNTNVLNSLPAAFFNAQGVYTASSIPANTFLNGFSYFAVYKSTGTVTYNTLVNRIMNTGGVAFNLYNTYREPPNSAGTGTQGFYSNYNLYNTSSSIYYSSISPVAGAFKEFSNGTSTGTYTLTTWTPTDTGTVLYIGTRNDKNLGFIGNMHEVLVFNTDLSTIDRQRLEGYLAWKWGLQASLPVSHPYYVLAPVSPIKLSTAPGAPTSLASSEATATSFKISWSGAQGATSYTYTLGGVTTVPTTNAGVASKYAIFTGLNPGQSYAVIVTAVLSGITTSSSTLNTATLPTAPNTFTTSAVNSTGFTVNWIGGLGATSYTYTLNGSSVTPSVDNGVASRSATFTGLTEGTSYTISVTAVNSSGSTPGKIVPSSLVSGLQLWLDGEDPNATGITPTLNSALTSWKDKTSNNNHYTLTNATYSYDSVYARNGVLFSGTTSGGFQANASLSPFANTYQWTIFTVHRGTNSSSSVQTVWRQNPTNVSYLVGWQGNPRVVLNTSFTVPSSSYDAFSGLIAVVSLGNSAMYSFNGTAASSITVTPNGMTSSSKITIASSSGNADSLTGYMDEVLVFNTNLSASDRQKIEGYLAWKWNIQSKLPVGHPYYSSAVPLLLSSTAPGAPTSLASSEITVASFKVSWSGGQGATSYTYTINGVTTVPETDAGIASKFAIFTGLSAGVTYVVIVNSVLSGVSTSSSSLSVTTVPSKPYRVTVSNITSSGFRLSWVGGLGATSYRYTFNDQAISPSDSQDVSNKIATFSGLSSGTNYTILIYAVNSGGESIYMSEPTQISGLQSWLDGNDPLNNGSTATNRSNLTNNTWYDKTGNGYNMVFTSTGTTNDALLPSGASYSNNSINSLNTILLNNTMLQGTISIPAGTFSNNYVGFLVYKTMNGKGYAYFGRTDTNGYGALDIFGVQRYFSNSPGGQIPGGIGVAPELVNGNTTGLFNFTLTNYASTGGTGAYNEYINSTLTNPTGASLTGLNISDFNSKIYFGGRGGTSNSLYEYYCEILIYNTNISSTNRTLVEGYLAWKWGIQNKLRSDHPYKSVAPVIGLVVRTLS